eukprot:c12314_g2_i1 orf=569-3556(-)
MPGRLAENEGSPTVIVISSVPDLNLEESSLLAKRTSLDAGGHASPSSPHDSFIESENIDAQTCDAADGSPPPHEANQNVQNAAESCLREGDQAEQIADQVSPDPFFLSCVEGERNGIVLEPITSAQEPIENGGSEAALQEHAINHKAEAEDKLSHAVAADHSPSPHQGKAAQHNKEGNGHSSSLLSAKLNPKKKPILSPRSQSKLREADKEKLYLPKSAGNKPKERIASPKLPSAAASALKAKEMDRGKVGSLDLPLSDAVSAVNKVKEAEKEKIYSPKAPKELEKERSRLQDPLKLKDKTKQPSPTTQSKRPPPLTVKLPENPSLTENSKRIAALKDLEKASPKSPSSPVRSSVKASPISPLRCLQIIPSSSSEKAPNSASRTPPSKQAPRPTELSKVSPESPMSANRITDRKTTTEKASLDQEKTPHDGEKAHQKVKAFFEKRKSGVSLGSRKFGDNESIASSEQTSALTRENPSLGPFLLKLARQAVMSGDNPLKALDYARRAAKSYESAADGKPSLDLVMSLHILAATHCTLGQFEEAIPVLQHSIEVTDIEGGGQEHALAAFAGNMQLGDTFSLLGRGEDALAAYHTGLEVQKRALGETDPHVGETCRYLAEAHTQAMQFDKAEELCQHALNIHQEHSAPASVEEATDRRLMGLIYNGKGQHEAALEHLVLASMALIANSKDVDVAAVDTSIGDTYVSLGRFDEAVFSYQKALTVFKASKGESHVAVALVYVSLAELYLKMGKFRECKTYCDSALRIFNKHGAGHPLDEVACGLTELAVVYEALNEQEQALSLLKKALGILDAAPGQQSAIAGVEAQIGVLSYMCGNYTEAHCSLSKAVSKLRASTERTSALFGIVLNQMGLCCLHLSEIGLAVELFEESRSVLETACGPHHPDTLTVYSNLAGAYDALGRLDDAIGALQYVVEVREEELGTANSEVEDERSRLAELLREAGRFRARRLNNTLALLMEPKFKPKPSILAMPGQKIVSVTG